MSNAKITSTNVSVAAGAAALLVAPLAVFAAAGQLEPTSAPVALLLGAFLVALAAYAASAVSLFGRSSRREVSGASADAAPAAC